MDDMDDHPSSSSSSSSIGLHGMWMLVHGSSRGRWIAIWTVWRGLSIDNLMSKIHIHGPLLDIDNYPYCAFSAWSHMRKTWKSEEVREGGWSGESSRKFENARGSERTTFFFSERTTFFSLGDRGTLGGHGCGASRGPVRFFLWVIGDRGARWGDRTVDTRY